MKVWFWKIKQLEKLKENALEQEPFSNEENEEQLPNDTLENEEINEQDQPGEPSEPEEFDNLEQHQSGEANRDETQEQTGEPSEPEEFDNLESTQSGEANRDEPQDQPGEPSEPGEIEEPNNLEQPQSGEANQEGTQEPTDEPSEPEESDNLEQPQSREANRDEPQEQNGEPSESEESDNLEQPQSREANRDETQEQNGEPSEPEESDNLEQSQNGEASQEGTQEPIDEPGEIEEPNDLSFAPGEEELLEELNDESDKLKELFEDLDLAEEEYENQEDNENKAKQQLYKRFKEVLQKYKDELEERELNDNAQNIVDKLKDIPPFEERETSDGYALENLEPAEIPESLIRTLMRKFLRQRFTKSVSDLNNRSESLERTKGFLKWNVKDLAIHLESEQITKALQDKYSYEYAENPSEQIPLAFYFDLSGSMSEYVNVLVVMILELLKNNVKVIAGYNSSARIQIDSIDNNFDESDLVELLNTTTNYSVATIRDKEKYRKIKYKLINKDIDEYLIEHKCERCAVFADFDPISSVYNLADYAKTYWFCFEEGIDYRLESYDGFAYEVHNMEDLADGLVHVSENRFEKEIIGKEKQTLKKV